MSLLSYLGPLGIIYLYGIFFLLAPYYIFLVRKNLVNSTKFTTTYSAVFFILGIYLLYVSPTPFVRICFLVGVVSFVNWKLFKFLKSRPQNTIYKETFIGVLKTIAVLFSLFITFILMVLIGQDYIETYEDRILNTDPNILVEACGNDTGNCYTLKAYLIGGYCETEDYYRTRSGYCVDSYIEKIYFENGGYRAFGREDCREISSNEWLCADNDGDDWDIEFIGKIKIE